VSESISPSATTADNTTAREQPSVAESLAGLNQASRQSWEAAGQALHALQQLLQADLMLARSALRQALLWSVVLVMCGTSAWLLLLLSAVIIVQWLGAPWPLALLAGAGFSGLTAWMALQRIRFYLRHTSLAATRRQWAQLYPSGKTENGKCIN